MEVGLIKQTRTAACQDCPEVLGLCSQLSKEDKHERRGKNPKTDPVSKRSRCWWPHCFGCVLKTLNNSHLCTSCSYSRRLRPQTPQRSDDEGGKSPLTVPQLCVSPWTRKPPPVGAFPAHSSSASRADKQTVRSHDGQIITFHTMLVRTRVLGLCVWLSFLTLTSVWLLAHYEGWIYCCGKCKGSVPHPG